MNVLRNLAFLEEDAGLRGKIFGLDLQIIFDAVILALAVFFLFFLLSYFVFNPAREFLAKRQERIASDLAVAADEKREAMEFKAEYDARLREADAEVDRILSEGKRKAKRRESEIIDAANAEASPRSPCPHRARSNLWMMSLRRSGSQHGGSSEQNLRACSL